MQIGDVRAFLTVVAKEERRGRITMWRVRCACGVERVIQPGNWGRVFSCGCQRGRMISEKRTSHGHSRRQAQSITYSTWLAMRQRCLNPRNPKFPAWGGRGITICERWNEYASFLSDLGPRPSLQHSLDRIDNDGNYEPDNCRWASPREQSSNTRRTVLLTFGNRTQTIAEWARITGLPVATMYYRAHAGWSAERIISTPIGR